MASAMRKMAVYLGLVEDDDRRFPDKYDSYEDYDEYDDEPDVMEPEETAGYEGSSPREAVAARAEYAGYSVADNRVESVSPQPVDLMRITTLHPRTYNEARTIGEHFREGTPVIMNLTEMVDSDARRLVDFAAGLIFGLRGSIDKVTNKVFLLSPANVEVTAEDKARIAERGFFNQS
jgi:cell division inhibitor SepF